MLPCLSIECPGELEHFFEAHSSQLAAEMGQDSSQDEELELQPYMYIEDPDSFQQFLAHNELFWETHGGAAVSDGCIYVDLAHDHPAYLLTNLWIAKYLQIYRGGRVIGLLADWPKTIPHFDEEKVRTLARSFLVDDIVVVDDAQFEDAGMYQLFTETVGGLEGEDLRHAILDFASAEDPDLGWILYDSWIRQERIASCEESSDDLLECARRVFRARRGAKAAMSGGIVVAAVVGHYHYSPYSWIAREALSAGGRVYFQSLLLPVSIRRFNTLADFRRGRSADFVTRYESDVLPFISDNQLEAFSRRMFDVQGGVRQFFRVMDRPESVVPRDVFVAGLGLNPAHPVVCLYAPALCGPPHCFGPLAFDDNGDWLRKSLDLAAGLPEITFLVKPHPQDATYDTSGLVERLKKIYGERANVRFLDNSIAPNQVAESIDLAVTISGTPGYELAARGIRTLAAGPSRYSGLGFCQESTSISEYRTLLSQVAHAPLNAEAARAALTFMFFEMSAGRSHSYFIPGLHLQASSEFWIEAARRLRAGLPEEDPLLRNLAVMVETDAPFLPNVDVLGSSTSRKIEVERSVALAGLHAVAIGAQRRLESRIHELGNAVEAERAAHTATRSVMLDVLRGDCVYRFGLGGSGNTFLREGWSFPEHGGIWTDGEYARIELPVIPPGTKLTVEFLAFSTLESPERRISVYCVGATPVVTAVTAEEGLVVLDVPLSVDRTQTEVIFFIANPEIPDGGTRRLGLWLQSFRLRPSGEAESPLA